MMLNRMPRFMFSISNICLYRYVCISMVPYLTIDRRSPKDWYQPAVDVAYGPQLEEFWREAAHEHLGRRSENEDF